MGRLTVRLAARCALLLALAAGCASTPETVHVVKPGETVYRLSRYYGVPPARIVRANKIRDVSEVPVGARLVIPGTSKAPPAVARRQPAG